jgi:GWxTD domain-containing protein
MTPANLLKAVRIQALVALAASLAMLRANAQPVRDETPESLQMDLLGFAGQNPDTSRLDAYINVGYDLLSFVKSDDRYSASYEVTLTLADSDGTQRAEQNWVENIPDVSFDESVSSSAYHLIRRSFLAPPGRYQVTCVIRDLDTKVTTRIQRTCHLRRFGGPATTVSDLMLLSKVAFTDGKRSITPNISGNVGSYDEPFGLFFQLYTSIRDSLRCHVEVDGGDKTPVYRSDTTVIPTAERNDIVLQVPHESLSLGDYTVSITLALPGGDAGMIHSPIAGTKRPIMVRWRGIPRSVKDIDLAIEQLMYIAHEDEIARLRAAQTLEEKQKAFFEFWKKRDPNPSTPRNEKMLEFYARVDYANRHFSHYREGWRSDMGMVYIILGPPSSVDRHPFEIDSKPYEIWSYFDLNFACVFLDQTGFGDYRLLTPLTEIYTRRRD